MYVFHNVMQASPALSGSYRLKFSCQTLRQGSAQSSIGHNRAQDTREAPKRKQSPKRQLRGGLDA